MFTKMISAGGIPFRTMTELHQPGAVLNNQSGWMRSYYGAGNMERQYLKLQEMGMNLDHDSTDV